MRYSTVTAAICATAMGSLPILVSASQPQFMEQGFLFDWNPTGTTVPIPVTEQCETIHINWARNSATGPNPTAPYYLQIFTSTFIVPFIVAAGSGQSFDFDVPFVPNTQYQICMFDSLGVTGGCQAIYTVIPNSNSSSPSCNNVTFPAGAMDVDGGVYNGALSQYGWVPQCTDISVTPKNGTPPYTFEIAPSSHPPLNITSDTVDTMNWTVSLSYGSSFFLTVGDSEGNRWSQGPIHSGANTDTACLDLSRSDTAMVTRSTAIGAGVGGAFGGLLIGTLLAFAFFVYRHHRSGGQGMNPFSSKFTSIPRFSMSEEGQPQYDELGHVVTGGSVSHPGRSPTSAFSRQPSDTPYTVEPFVLPGPSPNESTSGPDRQTSTHDVGSSTTSRPNTAPRTAFGSLHGQSGSSGPRTLSSDSTNDPPSSPSADRRDGSNSSEPPQAGRGNSHVYVVHHDGGRAPVTVYTEDGAEVVELPPRYMDDMREGTQPRGRDSSGGGGGGGVNPVDRTTRQPGSVPRKPRGARTGSGTGSGSRS